jgi:carboxylesterase
MLPFNPFLDPQHEGFSWPGGKPAALLVHGFPGSPAEMRPLGQALHEKGWTVRGVLLPGFGAQIESLPERTFEEWRAAVRQALDELRADHSPLLVGGVSMGAALSLSVTSDSSVDGLILLSPFWKLPWALWSTLPVVRKLIPRIRPFHIWRPDFSDPNFRQGLGTFLPGMDIDDPAVRQAIREFALPTALFDEIRRTGLAGGQAAQDITCPALIVQGLQDPLALPRMTRRLAARFAGPTQYIEVQAEHNLPDATQPAWPEIRAAAAAFADRIARSDKNQI